MQKFSLVFIFFVLILLINVGFEFYENGTDPFIDQADIGASYESYSEGINTILFDAYGQITYTLQARTQITYLNSITELEEPFIQLYREDDSRWNIIADSGRISTSAERSNDVANIDFSGNVEAHRIDVFGNRTMLATEFLSVDPESEILKTDLFVTILGENFEQTSVGMQVNLQNDEFQFYRDIRGRYGIRNE